MSGYVPLAEASSPLVGPVPGDTAITLSFALTPPNMDAMLAQAQAVSDPGHASYRHYLTPAQFTATYAPSAGDYAQLGTFLQGHNLPVTATYPNRLVTAVSGTASAIEQALFVNLNYYLRPDGTQFFAPDQEPSLNLALPLLSVGGLNDYVQLLPANVTSGPFGVLSWGTDYRTDYLGGTTCFTLTGSGQVVGVLDGAGFSMADIAAYSSATNEIPVPIVTVPVNGAVWPEPAADCGSGSCIETTEDVNLVAAMAPGLEQINVFQFYDIDLALSAVATTCSDGVTSVQTNPSCPLALQVSASYLPATTNETVVPLAEMALQGQSFFVASGDHGAYAEPAIYADLLAQEFVTVAGATAYYQSGSPSAVEEAWEASGGGFVPLPQPVWQQGITSNGASALYRNVPDVAMLGYYNAVLYGCPSSCMPEGVEGTSQAAPLWAGFTALVNGYGAEQGRLPVGFINPTIYAIGTSGAYQTAFNDVTQFEEPCPASECPNGVQPIGPGYDMVTGWGSPKCALVDLLASCTSCGSGCTDLDTDSNNCGACGTVCLAGGQCIGGACQPVKLASVLGLSLGVATDGTNVYWTDQGADNVEGLVQSVPVGGGATTSLASSLTVPTDLALAANTVFWASGSDPGGDALFAVAATGGSYEAVVQFQNAVVATSVAADDKNLYWTSSQGGVFQAPMATGSPITTLVAIPTGPVVSSVSDVAVDATSVYWFEVDDETLVGQLLKTPIGGGTVTSLASGLTDPVGLAVDGMSVYWGQADGIDAMPVDGGAIRSLATTSAFPSELAIDGTNVYWTTTAGQIQKAPISGGGAVSTLATVAGAGPTIAVSETAVFWTVSGTTVAPPTGAVYVIAK